MTVSVSGGLLVHGQTTGGLNSGSDWDSAKAGDQTVPADGTFTVVVNGGDGNDALTVLAKNTEIAATTLNGGGGDDVLTGADTNDTLNGGDGNDRLIGAKGTDAMNGDGGNDTLVWNNGDGSDRIDGDAGNDSDRGQRLIDPRRRVHPRSRAGRGEVPAHEPGARSRSTRRPSTSRSTASAATTPSRRTTASVRSRCCRSTAAPAMTPSTARTVRT